MPKFFVNPSNIFENNIIIDGEDVKHITKVLRLSKKDDITICDGFGFDYLAEIEKIENNLVYTKILSKTKNLSEPKINITLFQGLPKSDKMEYIIMKATELGISQIIPVVTKNTVVKIEDKKEKNKVERWNKISLQASKQSGRGLVPNVGCVIDFDKAISQIKNYDLAIIPYELEKNNKLKNVLSKNETLKNIAVFIGPEGGFDQSEIKNATNNNVIPVTLGNRILKTETAGISVLSILMYHYNEM